MKSSSILDNFLCNQGFIDKVLDAGPVHLGDNRSRHSPIMMKVDIGNIPTKQPAQEPRSCRKPAWYKASEENINEYTDMLDQGLASLSPPASLSCHDVNCMDEEHTRERDVHVMDIMCNIMEASHKCIPMGGGGKSSGKPNSTLPGWKEIVAPAKEDSLFWHGVWISAGKPNSGVL